MIRFSTVLILFFLLTALADPTPEDQWKAFLATAKPLEDLKIDAAEDLFQMESPAHVELPLTGPPGFRFPLVELEIGGQKLLAIFDTGAGGSLITAEAALRAGVVPMGRPPRVIPATGFGGTGGSVPSVATTLRWGGGEVANVRFSVIPGWRGMDILPGEERRLVEVVLGYDLMLAYDWVDVQPASRTIRLGRGIPPPPYPHVSHPLLPQQKGAGPRVEVTLANGKKFPATLDTGGYFALRVPARLAEELGLRRRDYVSLPEQRVSATGASETYRGLPTAMSLGDLHLSRVAVDIAAGNDEANERIGALLGNPLLSRIRWTLDHRARQIRFEVTRAESPPAPPASP